MSIAARPTPRARDTAGPLRAAGRIAAVTGAVGAVALTVVAGRQSAAPVLVAPFALWVVSPFAALFLADRRSKAWSALTCSAIYATMIAVAAGTLAVYGVAARYPLRTRTFLFVILPPISWLLIAIVLAAAWVASRTPAVDAPSAPDINRA